MKGSEWCHCVDSAVGRTREECDTERFESNKLVTGCLSSSSGKEEKIDGSISRDATIGYTYKIGPASTTNTGRLGPG